MGLYYAFWIIFLLGNCVDLHATDKPDVGQFFTWFTGSKGENIPAKRSPERDENDERPKKRLKSKSPEDEVQTFCDETCISSHDIVPNPLDILQDYSTNSEATSCFDSDIGYDYLGESLGGIFHDYNHIQPYITEHTDYIDDVTQYNSSLTQTTQSTVSTSDSSILSSCDSSSVITAPTTHDQLSSGQTEDQENQEYGIENEDSNKKTSLSGSKKPQQISQKSKSKIGKKSTATKRFSTKQVQDITSHFKGGMTLIKIAQLYNVNIRKLLNIKQLSDLVDERIIELNNQKLTSRGIEEKVGLIHSAVRTRLGKLGGKLAGSRAISRTKISDDTKNRIIELDKEGCYVHTEIADMVGCSLRSVYRCLKAQAETHDYSEDIQDTDVQQTNEESKSKIKNTNTGKRKIEDISEKEKREIVEKFNEGVKISKITEQYNTHILTLYKIRALKEAIDNKVMNLNNQGLLPIEIGDILGLGETTAREALRRLDKEYKQNYPVVKLSADKINQIKDLGKKGIHTRVEIAEIVGCSKNTVGKYLEDETDEDEYDHQGQTEEDFDEEEFDADAVDENTDDK